MKYILQILFREASAITLLQMLPIEMLNEVTRKNQNLNYY